MHYSSGQSSNQQKHGSASKGGNNQKTRDGVSKGDNEQQTYDDTDDNLLVTEETQVSATTFCGGFWYLFSSCLPADATQKDNQEDDSQALVPPQ